MSQLAVKTAVEQRKMLVIAELEVVGAEVVVVVTEPKEEDRRGPSQLMLAMLSNVANANEVMAADSLT